MAWEERQWAYIALRSVFHTLRDRLLPDEAAHLASQLPMLLRGLYYEGYKPAHKPIKARTADELFQGMHKAFDFRDTGSSAEEIARGVITVMAKHISAGELDEVFEALPAEIREQLKPAAATQR